MKMILFILRADFEQKLEDQLLLYSLRRFVIHCGKTILGLDLTGVETGAGVWIFGKRD